MYQLVIGIAAKNEENCIFECLESVEKALLAYNQSSQILVCLNNCTDNTEEEVIRFASSSVIEVLVLHSTGSLISAQRTIFYATKVRPIVFLDADSRITAKTLRSLIEGLKMPVVLTYAKSVNRTSNNHLTLVTKVFNLYQTGKFLTKRYYFHGRVFATYEWNFPTELEILERAYNTNSFHLLKYGKGLLLDDVFLSAYLLNKYGDSAIKEIKTAKVEHRPIKKWRDWWRTYRRIRIEMIKIETWFSEYSSLKPKLYRKTNWKVWNKANISEKILWLIYLLFKLVSNLSVRSEIMLAKFTRYRPSNQWKVAESTKLVSDDRKIIMFDIDGTLINKTDIYYLDPQVKTKIKKMIGKGMTIGIATNRSFEGAKEVYDSLEMNGPLLAEGGGRIFLKNRGVFKEIKIRRKADIYSLISEKLEKYVNLKEGNYSLKINSDLKAISKNCVEIHVSKHRVNSASIYVYKNGIQDNEIAVDINRYLNSVLPEFGVASALGFGSGKLHVSFLDVSKNSALTYLKNKFYKNYILYMIGDSEITRSNDAIFYLGVNHADEAYRKVCSYVTPHPDKHGLLDLINFAEIREP